MMSRGPARLFKTALLGSSTIFVSILYAHIQELYALRGFAAYRLYAADTVDYVTYSLYMTIILS